eukprot:TRINITY_DN341_c0_g1_i4.p1 TRINITY_DN341_c0_g1~~TRINITY_DN341_c0_g1_i4.p1  ORF type:complete len:590 (-),score=196.53 TRINITY_DN341_c0_g1_i4:2051-3820(-)
MGRGRGRGNGNGNKNGQKGDNKKKVDNKGDKKETKTKKETVVVVKKIDPKKTLSTSAGFSWTSVVSKHMPPQPTLEQRGGMPSSSLSISSSSALLQSINPDGDSFDEGNSSSFQISLENVDVKLLRKTMLQPIVGDIQYVIKPRGLINRGNSCFMNSALQILMACSPFVRFITSFQRLHLTEDQFPHLAKFVEHMSFFERHVYHREGDKVPSRFMSIGKPFTPIHFHDLLAIFNNSGSQVTNSTLHYLKRGYSITCRQQDAQEFYSFMLDSLHEELVEGQWMCDDLLKDEPEQEEEQDTMVVVNDTTTSSSLTKNSSTSNSQNAWSALGLSMSQSEEQEETPSNSTTNVVVKQEDKREKVEQLVDDNDQDEDDDDGDEWLVVGKNNEKTVHVSEKREEGYVTTGISKIFGGKLRSVVRKQGERSSTSTQPFYCLPLDIDDDNINSLEDALRWFTRKEEISGYKSSKTGMEINASKQVLLEETPPIFAIHLKRFNYWMDSANKVHRFIEFPLELKLGKNLTGTVERSYELFGIICHLGDHITNGHYTSIVKQPYEEDSWLCFNDSKVSSMTDEEVLDEGETVYLLFYKAK